MNSRTYISSTTLDDWFDGYNADQGGWVISDIINSLQDALAESHILMIDALEEDRERFDSINDAIVSALIDLKQLKKDVANVIKNGELLVPGNTSDADKD